MLKLYGNPRSRASIVQWYLEELGIPYEFVLLDIAAQDNLKTEFLAINPMGKVPAIADGDFYLWESGAILLYLAEKYGNLSNSLEERSIISQWVLFANSTLSSGLFVEAYRTKDAPRLLGALNKILTERPFLLGDTLSVVDIAVGSILAYAPLMLGMKFDEYPAVDAYLKGLTALPSFQNTIGKR